MGSGFPGYAQDIDQLLHAWAREIEPALAGLLDGSIPDGLVDAMQYAALSEGKRFRPFLVAVCFDVLQGCPEQARSVGLAAEMMHTASLILDDLPSMDAAEARRTVPALHVRFTESTAILAAMSLVLKSFELLSAPSLSLQPERKLLLIQRFAECCGASGLAGGQFEDLNGYTGNGAHKTASLMSFCCEAPAIATGADRETAERFRQFGEGLGRLFQARDDELDGSRAVIRKADALQGARRFVELLPMAPAGSSIASVLPHLPDWLAERAS